MEKRFERESEDSAASKHAVVERVKLALGNPVEGISEFAQYQGVDELSRRCERRHAEQQFEGMELQAACLS